jgi:phosphoglycerate dehydrogenase-like enzyme
MLKDARAPVGNDAARYSVVGKDSLRAASDATGAFSDVFDGEPLQAYDNITGRAPLWAGTSSSITPRDAARGRFRQGAEVRLSCHSMAANAYFETFRFYNVGTVA